MEAAVLEGGEEVAPVDLGLAQGDADAENGALSRGADADGDEHGAGEDGSLDADLFVAGIEGEVGIGLGVEAAGAPLGELLVEGGCGAADLGGGDVEAAELFEHGGDTAGGDALDIHLGDGQGQGALAAGAAFKGGGIEIHAAADLGDGEGELAEAGVEGLGFEAIGVALAGVGALVGLGREHAGALDLHGLVEEEGEGVGEAVGAVFENEGDDRVEG